MFTVWKCMHKGSRNSGFCAFEYNLKFECLLSQWFIDRLTKFTWQGFYFSVLFFCPHTTTTIIITIIMKKKASVYLLHNPLSFSLGPSKKEYPLKVRQETVFLADTIKYRHSSLVLTFLASFSLKIRFLSYILVLSFNSISLEKFVVIFAVVVDVFFVTATAYIYSVYTRWCSFGIEWKPYVWLISGNKNGLILMVTTFNC